MIVMDIDQDFFFYPPKYDKYLKKQIQVIDVQDFINRYKIKNKKYVIFRDHDQVYWYIKNNIKKIDKLLHFDAHHDLYQKTNKIDEGNWINFLLTDKICSDVDWIVSHKEVIPNDFLHETITQKRYIENIEYKQTNFDYQSHSWEGKIDHVLFTISPKYCPDLKVLNDFIKLMA